MTRVWVVSPLQLADVVVLRHGRLALTSELLVGPGGLALVNSAQLLDLEPGKDKEEDALASNPGVVGGKPGVIEIVKGESEGYVGVSKDE